MGCSGSTNESKMTLCGFLCGFATLVTLTTALLGPTWLHTEEKLSFPHLPPQFMSALTVRFKIGLFKVCPQIIQHINFTIQLSTPGCTRVKYNSLADMTSQELGFNELEFTPLVVSKMRIAVPFQITAVALIFVGTFLALIGHFFADYKTMIACGLFLLGGLSLGGGLIVLVSALSDASLETPKRYGYSSSLDSEDGGLPQYQYGWCLQLSGVALILAEIAALISVSGYMARFSTVEDMVRVIVPGAERKLREQQGLSSEYLVRAQQKSPGVPQASTFEEPIKETVILGVQRLNEMESSMHCKTAPDICTSNPQAISYIDRTDLARMLPVYPDPHFTFVDKNDPEVSDSRLSEFVDKDGSMDSRIPSGSRQKMIAFTNGQEHIIHHPEPRYVEFCPGGRIDQCSNNPMMNNVMVVSDPRRMTYADGNLRKDGFIDPKLNYKRFNNLAGQTVPIMLKHNSPATIQAQEMYENFAPLDFGTPRITEAGTSSNLNSTQRSMTLQNPKKKTPIAQNTFSTLEYENRAQRNSGAPSRTGFYPGSAV